MKVLVAAVLGIVVLGGCSDSKVLEESPVTSGVTTFCDRGHRLYLYHGGYAGGLAVVPNGCPEGQ